MCHVWVKRWQVYVDDASNARGSGVGIFMLSLKGLRMENSFRLGFHASNNETEYEALIAELRAVQKLGAEEVEVYSDSRLVVSQIEGSFKAKDYHMFEVVPIAQIKFPKIQCSQIIKESE